MFAFSNVHRPERRSTACVLMSKAIGTAATIGIDQRDNCKHQYPPLHHNKENHDTHQQRKHHVVGLRLQEGAQRWGVVLDDAEQHIRSLQLGGLIANFEDACELHVSGNGGNRVSALLWGARG